MASQTGQYPHPNALVCERGDEGTATAVATGSRDARSLVDPVKPLREGIGCEPRFLGSWE